MEFHTKAISRDATISEVAEIVNYFTEKGYDSCEVMLGFGWALSYYTGSEWLKETVLLKTLTAFILELEDKGLGKVCNDDFYIWVGNSEFKLCNDSDIHLSCNKIAAEHKHFLERWDYKGYDAVEHSS
ncbi:hypothetical protein I6F43_19925 [Pseudoalteromonas sp. NZS71_1]|uniref:hypothetical protein n=1 Tax=Pseudoalteromonas sp. NZS71_1 TaxID=2792072 RepID=UPI0018CF2DF5|nr:hypothetical protein [Pseudoalteromonas sp. NZS71_1]MBH0036907.1 hypothetical protein [Pseudoalteromonas sp. NZS71_1]